MLRKLSISCLGLSLLACAHGTTPHQSSDQDDPQVTESKDLNVSEEELQKKYHDTRYESDPAFKKYYEEE